MVIVSARATMIAASCFLTHLCIIVIHPLRMVEFTTIRALPRSISLHLDLVLAFHLSSTLPAVRWLSSSSCHALEAMSYYPLTIRAIPLVSDIDSRMQQTDTAASQVPLEIELTDYTQKLDTATRSQ